jgi:hypothetical protein
MSGTATDGSKEGPALATSVTEVQGTFPTDAAVQEAVSSLTLVGYDRADFSLPEDRPAAATPTEGAENPTDDIDKAQLRTMGTSMAGYAGAVAVAGAVIATGGAAALAVGGAALVGAGTAAAANAGGQAADQAGVDDRNRRGAEGTLVLAVRATSKEQAEQIMGIMQQSGASKVTPVERGDQNMTAGVSSASWTG